MESKKAVRKPAGPPHSYTASYTWASRCATCTLHILELDHLNSPEKALEVVVPRGSRSIHHAVCVAGTEYARALEEEGPLELRFKSPCACGSPVDLAYLTPDSRIEGRGPLCVLAVPREHHVRVFHRTCIDARLAFGATAQAPEALYTFLLAHCTADTWKQHQTVASVLVGAHAVGEPHASEGDLPVGVVFHDLELSHKYRDAAARHPALKDLSRSAVLLVPHSESAWLDGPEGKVATSTAGLQTARVVVGGYTLVQLPGGTVRPSTHVPRTVSIRPYLRLTETSAACAAVEVPGMGDIVPVFW